MTRKARSVFLSLLNDDQPTKFVVSGEEINVARVTALVVVIEAGKPPRYALSTIQGATFDIPQLVKAEPTNDTPEN